MPTLRFASAFQRHVACPTEAVAGATVRDALHAYLVAHPAARDYVIDQLGALRRHVVLFVDGAAVRDRGTLSDAAGPDAVIDVMQALSGG